MEKTISIEEMPNLVESESPGSWRTEKVNELYLALSKFQGEVEVLPYDSQAEIKNKEGRVLARYKYSSLANLWNTIRKPLAKHELCLIQRVENDTLHTILAHSSGQEIYSTLDLEIPDGYNKNQARGSALTYARRYAISSLLGIVSQEDDDASMESESFQSGSKKKIKRRYTVAMRTEIEEAETLQDITAVANKYVTTGNKEFQDAVRAKHTQIKEALEINQERQKSDEFHEKKNNIMLALKVCRMEDDLDGMIKDLEDIFIKDPEIKEAIEKRRGELNG